MNKTRHRHDKTRQRHDKTRRRHDKTRQRRGGGSEDTRRSTRIRTRTATKSYTKDLQEQHEREEKIKAEKAKIKKALSEQLAKEKRAATSRLARTKGKPVIDTVNDIILKLDDTYTGTTVKKPTFIRNPLFGKVSGANKFLRVYGVDYLKKYRAKLKTYHEEENKENVDILNKDQVSKDKIRHYLDIIIDKIPEGLFKDEVYTRGTITEFDIKKFEKTNANYIGKLINNEDIRDYLEEEVKKPKPLQVKIKMR